MTREIAVKNCSIFTKDARDNNTLYFGLGKRSTSWSGDPDQIMNTQEEKENFWAELLGIKRIETKDVIMLVPKRTWTSGLSYVVFDSTSENAFDDPFYVMTSNNEVFVCTTVGGGTSTNEPNLAAAVAGVYTGADGYIWRYQYTTNTYDLQQSPNTWMPVPFDGTVNTTDTYANKYAYITLGTRYLLLKAEISDPFVSSEFTAGEFRQVGLIANPLLSSGDSVINTYEPVANLLTESGTLVYLENREVQSVTNGQNSSLKIIIRF